MQKLLTTNEMAQKLRCPVSTIYEYSRQGRLPGRCKIGKRVLFDEAEIELWIEELKEKRNG